MVWRFNPFTRKLDYYEGGTDDAVTLEQVKADTDIADALSKKHASGSDNQVVPATLNAVANTFVTAYNSTTGAWTTGNPTGSSATSVTLAVRNETGSTITKGKVVYISGYNNVPLITLCDNTTVAGSKTIGIVLANISHETNGTVVIIGTLSGINTDAFTVGDNLYLSTSGDMVNSPPAAGVVLRCGVVTVKNSTTGAIEFRVTHSRRYFTAPTGEDLVVRMGDSAGAKKTIFKDYANAEVASVDSDGDITGVKVSTDTIEEKTSAAGVTIDGVLIKDGLVDGKDVSTLIEGSGVAKISVSAIQPQTPTSGDIWIDTSA